MTPDFSDISSHFDQRLDGSGAVGVAVSGGGDSVALLHLLAQWGRRPLEVFCVDHGLNPDSGRWTEGVRQQADKLGAGFTALTWDGPKPATGISAAARTARHRLLAEATRAKGTRVLCLGHTRDDIAESALMQAEGSNVGAPKTWSPSPVWPQGRGLFLFRPLLDIRRADLRQWLARQGIPWIDDPANISNGSLRARVRRTVASELPPHEEPAPLLTRAEADAMIDPQYAAHGLIALRRAVLAPEKLRKLLALAVVCAGGGDKLPRSGDIERLLAKLGTAQTLCGARIEASEDLILIARDGGDIARHPRPGDLWDGRFEIGEPGPIIPSAAVRPRPDGLRALPSMLRDSQPLTEDKNPVLRQNPYRLVEATCRVLPRFLAAAGAFTRESEISL